MNSIVFLIVGAVAGWLANLWMKGASMGLGWNLLLGIGGAFVGSFVLGIVGFNASHLIGEIVTATFGAVLLLYAIPKIKAANKNK
ncbi:MAG: GlsB/YeaQ/YmgE family stress response membrane protein [Chitinophagales bacterium]